MNSRLPRWAASTLLLVAAIILTVVSAEAEARRFGGGMKFGRQSNNIMKQRPAVTPPAAKATPSAGTNTAAGAKSAAAAGAAKSGMSRWLGPIAGIAAGLGIAALLSSLGLSGAFLEFLSSAILIALVIFAIMFVLRRLRGNSSLATAGAYNRNAANDNVKPMFKQSHTDASGTHSNTTGAAPVIETVSATQDPSWFIPNDFDVPAFLDQAKTQFKRIQALWDAGDRAGLSQLLTDDMLVEITPKLPYPDDANITEIVLLNAELMGIETVAGGYLASVRYSGMLKENAGAQAERFEEVWNLYKADGQGWLLAGLQQIN